MPTMRYLNFLLGTWQGDTQTCEQGRIIIAAGMTNFKQNAINNDMTKNTENLNRIISSTTEKLDSSSTHTTWKTLSSSSASPASKLKKNDTSESGTSSSRGSEVMSGSEVSQNQILTWKDVSPTKSSSNNRDTLQGYQYTLCNHPLETNTTTNYLVKEEAVEKLTNGHVCGINESKLSHVMSGDSSDVTVEVKNVQESTSPQHCPESSSDDSCNNDYFYDEDFSVQFDSNLRESSIATAEAFQSASLVEFPHMLTGSYLSFNTIKGSQEIEKVHYDSELSGSRNSAMEVSSSEREILCSSDMIEISDGPLFTPTPNDSHQILLTDSLDKTCSKKQGKEEDFYESNTSDDGNLTVDCCPRKEEYFLSFDGSNSRISCSETDCSVTSHDSGQGHWNYSDGSISSHDSSHGQGNSQHKDFQNVCSSSDEGQENSDSFNFCFPTNKLYPCHQWGVQNVFRDNASNHHARRLCTVKETLQEQQEKYDNEHELGSVGTLQQTSPSKCVIVGSQVGKHRHVSHTTQFCETENTLTEKIKETEKTKTNRSDDVYLISFAKPSEVLKKYGKFSRRCKANMVSWKQVRKLRKNCQIDGLIDPSDCCSLPDLSSQTWQGIAAMKSKTVADLADSFHSKSHSASLLEFYQRLKSESTLVSPETLTNIEHILLPNFIGRRYLDVDRSDELTSSSSSLECPQYPYCQQTNLMDSITNKRILDWLKMDKSASRPSSLGCQTTTQKECHTKETVISPQTVTMWCGTKHFGTQFPPTTKDCGIQATDGNMFGMLNPCSKQDKEIQTSDPCDEDLMNLLSEQYDDLEFLKFTPGLKEPQFGIAISCPEKLQKCQKYNANNRPIIHRSKSEDTNYRLDDLERVNDNSTLKKGSHKLKHESNHNASKVSHSKSASQLKGPKHVAPCPSPLRHLGASSHYNYKSLPDLDFLKSYGHQNIYDENSSLFDPLQLPTPIPIFIRPQTWTEDLDGLLQMKKSSANEHQLNGSLGYPRVQPNPGKNSRHGSSTVPSAVESESSSSGFSTSSTSSGIDPGSSDSRSLYNSSPQNDIERLIFFPPHTDILKLTKKSHEPKKRLKSVPRALDSDASSGCKKLDRFACEMYPLATVTCSKTHPSQAWHEELPLITDKDDNTSEQLYSLEEENTPVPSPEKPSCCNLNECMIENYHISEEFNYNHACDFDYEFSHQLYSHEEDRKTARHLSNDSSSSSGSFVPNYNKKPLKSCLRKQDRVIRSRSMSDPFSFAQEEQKQTEKVKNRHSYACDDVYVVTDELGQLMMYQADDSAKPVLFYLDNNGECHMTEGGKQYECVPTDAADLGNSDGSSIERESSSGKRKSVSFASEVSFHAISPQMSPWRQHTTGIQASFDCSQPTGDANVPPHSSVNTCQEEHQFLVKDPQMGVQKVKEEEEQGDKTGQVEPHAVLMKVHLNEQHSSVLSEELQFKFGLFRKVSQAAEILVKHFAKSVDTFDKLRLGNTAECPEIGDIVLTKLCPALSEIIADGMKSYLPGLHMFGRVQVTVWKIVEASLEIGVDIRAVSELVLQLKQTSFLVTQQQKFDAFIFGLLNLRLLDFWIGYIQQKDELLIKYYNDESLFQLASGCLKTGYDSMIGSLQPLAILPFQLSVDYIKDRHLKQKQNKPPITGLNMTVEEGKMDLTSQKTTIDFLPGNKSSIENENTTASMLGSLGSPMTAGQANVLEKTAAKALNWLAKAALPLRKPNNDDTLKTKSFSDSLCAMTDSYQRHDYYERERPQQNFVRQSKSLGELDSELQGKPSDSLRSASVPSAPGMAAEQTDPISSLEKRSMRLNLEEQVIPESNQSVTSPSGLLQKLANLGSSWTQKQAYRKGVTEYSFEAGAMTAGNRSTPDTDTVQTLICGNEKKHAVKNSALKSHKNETETLGLTGNLNSDLTESPKKGAFDIINLFDKLLLPNKSDQEKTRANSRWSWTGNLKPGQDQGQTDRHLSQRCSQSDTASGPSELQSCTSKQSCSKPFVQSVLDSKGRRDLESKRQTVQTRIRCPAPPPKPPRMSSKLDITANGSKTIRHIHKT